MIVYFSGRDFSNINKDFIDEFNLDLQQHNQTLL
jgi:hypothetical protein